MTVKLAEDERDAILEIFNVGVGAAASTLSEMVGVEVLLTLPDLAVLDRRELVERDLCPLAAVYQGFDAPFGRGRAILSFPEKRSLALVSRLMQQDAPVDELTEMQEEALTEVGNILINSCLARLSDMANEEIVVSVPRLKRAHSLAGLLEEGEGESGVLAISVQFDLTDEQIEGRLLVITEVERLKPFIGMVQKAIMGG